MGHIELGKTGMMISEVGFGDIPIAYHKKKKGGVINITPPFL